MKITHFCLAGTITDGWSYQENMLSKYHAILGHNVSIITSNWVFDSENKMYKYPKTDYILENDIRVIRLQIKNKDQLGFKFKRYAGVIDALNKTEPDILFIHGCQFLDMDKVVTYLKKHSNIVVYVDNHADFSNSATNFLSKYILHSIIWRHTAQMILPYTRKFYGVLPARVEFLKNVYKIPESKVELLVMGGDDELVDSASKHREVIREKYHIVEKDFFIVSGGKIDKWKTQTILLMKAVQNIKKRNIKLLIFGSIDPELKNELEALVDGEKIQYIGWIQAAYSYDLFAAADLAVFPGRHSVFWEQVVAQGIPLVVKDWPGTHHIDLGGNVKYLREDSIEEIQKVISEIINSPETYKKMLGSAQKNKIAFSYKEIAFKSIN